MSVGGSEDHETMPIESMSAESMASESKPRKSTRSGPTEATRPEPGSWSDPTLPVYPTYAEPAAYTPPTDPNTVAYQGQYRPPYLTPGDTPYVTPGDALYPAPSDATYRAPGAVPYPYPGYAGAQYPPPYPDLGPGPGSIPANYPPPVYAPYGGHPPYGHPRAAQPTNALAIVALVLSLFFWPAGIICGVAARRQITRSGESGRGLATAAIVLGALQFAFIALLIVVGLAAH